MSDGQKAIKYLAIVFGAFLIISIITGAINFVLFFTNVVEHSDNNFKNININENVSTLKIDVASSKVNILEGATFFVKANSDTIKIKQNNDRLFITQNKRIFNSDENAELTIYVPSNLMFDVVAINNGSGSINIDKLVMKTLDFEFGAGKIYINNLFVTGEAKIEGGAGDIKIDNANIHNLDLDMGAGKVLITASLTGTNDIDSGIGAVNMNLLGGIDNYTFRLEKRIGSINIDGKNISNNTTYGMGNNSIDIEGGIGSININFIEG